MDERAEPVVAEQSYNASRDLVWKAITEPDQMRRWFFEQIEDFQPEPGFETEFNIHHQGKDYHHQWKIIEVVPLEKIVYDWRYKGIPGDGMVIWELSETPEGTRLKLTSQGLETFPDDDPAFTRKAGQEGWDYFIRNRLREFLERNA